MPSWISEHRADISFIMSMLVGTGIVAFGVFKSEVTMVLLGGGAIGLPGFSDIVKAVGASNANDKE